MGGSVPASFSLGEYEIYEIEELRNTAANPGMLFPTLARETLERHAGWLAPSYYNIADGTIILVIRSWLIKTRHHRILIDTCCGNDKPRPGPFPASII